MGGEISHEDERNSDDDSAEEEDGYYKPLQYKDIMMIPEINDALSSGKKEVQVGGAILTNIINDRLKEGTLTLKVQWDNEDTTWETLRDLKEDQPRLVASYLIAHDCSRRKKGSRDVNLIWAKKTLRKYDRDIRRITRLYDFYLDENNNTYSKRRAVINKGKRKRKPFR